MMPPTLALFFGALCLSLAGIFAAEQDLIGPTVLFSSDVTSLELGKSAKLSCLLKNFEPAKKRDYQVRFFQDDWFATYYVSAPDASGQRRAVYDNFTIYLPTLARRPVSSTFPLYEITVTPTVAGTKAYSCSLYQNLTEGHRVSILDAPSTSLRITATN